MMKRTGILMTLAAFAAASTFATSPLPMKPETEALGKETQTTPSTAAANIPPGAEGAKERLNTSPRHGEWADIEVPGYEYKLKSWVVYPESAAKAPVVIVIHEIYGLSDWVRAVADQLAADGFIAIAPDLLSGKGAEGKGTDGFPDRDAVTKAVRDLHPAAVTSALNAVKDYGTSLPASNGKFATVGFCWGGAASFRYATEQPALSAAVVYYGTSPTGGFENIKAPVLGIYAADDERVNSTVPDANEQMKENQKPYPRFFYDGAGHGFLRQQDGREGANKKAAEQAWPETVKFLRQHTK